MTVKMKVFAPPANQTPVTQHTAKDITDSITEAVPVLNPYPANGEYGELLTMPAHGRWNLTHCRWVTQICIFNTVKLGTSVSSP